MVDVYVCKKYVIYPFQSYGQQRINQSTRRTGRARVNNQIYIVLADPGPEETIETGRILLDFDQPFTHFKTQLHF
jgi:hypothetical protein